MPPLAMRLGVLEHFEDIFELLEQTVVYLDRTDNLSEVLLAGLLHFYFLSLLGTHETDCVSASKAFPVDSKFYLFDTIS